MVVTRGGATAWVLMVFEAYIFFVTHYRLVCLIFLAGMEDLSLER